MSAHRPCSWDRAHEAQRLLMIAGVAVLVWNARIAESGGSPPVPRNDTAIIVNAENATPDPSLAGLRSMMLLEKQFWPSGARLALYLPPSGSPARLSLLSVIYDMSDADLRRHWSEELFRGAIPAIPSSLRTTAAIAAAVQHSAGAISAVPAAEVPPGTRVLSIDGKRPGDSGYPLGASVAP